MKIKRLNLFRLSVYLFSIFFLCVGLSCKPKVIDLRVKGGSQEEINPSDTNPAEPIVPIDPKPIPIDLEEPTPIDPEEPTPIILTDPEESALSNKKIYTKLVSGGYHNCAITVNKHVVCWGSSAYGQVGAGEFKHYSPARLVKVDESHLLSDVIDIVSGNYHSCALLEDETVKCWGYNRNHNLGNGDDTTNKYYAVDVLTGVGIKLTDVKSIVSYGNNTCAIWKQNEENNGVRCWGQNNLGQLGNNNNSSKLYAVDVTTNGGSSNLKEVSKILIGANFGCALLENHTVKCWGSNSYGRLGDGTGTSKSYAVDVKENDVPTLLTNVKDLILGSSHACALLENSTVKCWGNNSSGRLGDGTTTDRSYATDVKVDEDTVLDNVDKVFLGIGHSCALLKDKTIKCWGKNSSGMIGIGNTTDQLYAVDVKVDEDNVLENVKDITLGSYNSCAIMDDEKNTIKCWGKNDRGQSGNGTTENTLYATTVKIDEDKDLMEVKNISVGKLDSTGDEYTCTLLKNNSIRCFGTNPEYVLGYGNPSFIDDFIEVPYLKNIVKIVTSRLIYPPKNSYCALFSDERVKCWGDNSKGQLGRGIVSNVVEPDYVRTDDDGNPILEEVKDIVSGINGVICVIVGENKKLKCWGRNNNGQLGTGDTVNKSYATDVKTGPSTSLENVEKVVIGDRTSCAIVGNEKDLMCWGDGYLGRGNTDSSYYAVNTLDADGGNLTNVSDAFLTFYNNCAIAGENSNLKCWGYNTTGQIGNGTSGSDVYKASSVVDDLSEPITGVEDVYVGDTSHSCAITGDRYLRCWGQNSNGQLGSGENPLLYAHSIVSNAKKYTSPSIVTCVISGGDNNLKCLGYSSYEQIGNKNVVSDVSVPTSVLDENDDPLLGVSDVKLTTYGACAISNGEVKCWGSDSDIFVNESILNYAKSMLNEDETILSNVKEILSLGEISSVILNDNTIKYWGKDPNSVIHKLSSVTYPDSLDQRKTYARSVFLESSLEPLSGISDVIYDQQHNIWALTTEGTVYFRGYISELANMSPYSLLAKPIDSSLVEEE